jgi:hypothetical protein
VIKVNENERQARIAEVRRVAAMPKTDHICMQPGCSECDHNVQVQCARNSMKELHPRAKWMWN